MMTTDAAQKPEGDLLIWVLIVSELAVFGIGLLLMLVLRASDPTAYAQAQSALDRTGAGVNAVLLITSGYLAARALGAARLGQRRATRGLLVGAALLGIGFLWLKGLDYAAMIAKGISPETHLFFMGFYMLTLFHAAHVVAGIVILLLLTWRCRPEQIEDGVAFWHMVDLVWVMLFPVLYILR